MVRISVIVPIYNSANYLQETLDSICQQSLDGLEIICVDDGSTDNSADIVSQNMSNDDRIKYIYQENQGPGAARNNGIIHSSGLYVAFMDSDDADPRRDSLELLYHKAIQHNVTICGGSIIDLYGDTSDDRLFSEEGFVDFDKYQSTFWFTRYIYNRVFLIDNQIQFPNSRCYEDPVFLLNAMCKAKRFYAICEPVYFQKESHTSGSSFSLDQIKDYAKGIIQSLSLADSFQYTKLFDFNVSLLQGHFRTISDQIIKAGKADQELFTLIFQANTAVFSSSLFSASRNQITEAFISPIECVLCSCSRFYEIRNRKGIRFLRSVKRSIKKLF